MMGRPSLYTPELVADIASRLAKGEPLAAICRDEGYPHPTTVRDWMAAREDVSLAIARAREDGFDVIAADCLNIADDGKRDYAPSEDGRETVDHDHIQRSKLRIDTRLKLLAKWDPKRYGEKLVTENTNTNLNHDVIDADELDSRLARAIAAASAQSGASEPKPS